MPKMEFPQIPKRLKALREAAGITQQELAVKAGLSMSLIAQMEQGERADPRLSTLAALAEALGMSIVDLVRGLVEPVALPRSAYRRPRKGK